MRTLVAAGLFVASCPWILLAVNRGVGTPTTTYTVAAFFIGTSLWSIGLLILRPAWEGVHPVHGVRVRTWAVGGLLSAASSILGSFALVYWHLSVRDSRCFVESLSKVDAIYFTLTTFSTTGFGDIFPQTAVCRAVVSAQMIVGIVLVTVVAAVAIARLTSSAPRR
jgi:hypothetical protein